MGLQDFHNLQDGGAGSDIGGGGARQWADMDPAVRIDIQEAISRFYTGRIGVRFLIEHHVSTLPPVRARTIMRVRMRVEGGEGLSPWAWHVLGP